MHELTRELRRQLRQDNARLIKRVWSQMTWNPSTSTRKLLTADLRLRVEWPVA